MIWLLIICTAGPYTEVCLPPVTLASKDDCARAAAGYKTAWQRARQARYDYGDDIATQCVQVTKEPTHD